MIPQANNDEVLFNLGNKYYYGINTDRNYTLAMKHYIASATAGHLESMVKLCDCYKEGLHTLRSGGCQADSEAAAAAREWLALASEQRNLTARFRLATEIIATQAEDQEQQQDQKQDRDNSDVGGYAIAVLTILECAEQGHADSQNWMGQQLEARGEVEEAVKWFDSASKNGHAGATNSMAMILFAAGATSTAGTAGAACDRQKAFELFLAAAHSGDPLAVNNAAYCLEHGHGTAKDVAAAMDMYKVGAERGDPHSAYSYGYLLVQTHTAGLLHEGKESVQEHAIRKGVQWIAWAQAAGVVEAGFQLGVIYHKVMVMLMLMLMLIVLLLSPPSTLRSFACLIVQVSPVLTIVPILLLLLRLLLLLLLLLLGYSE